MVELIVNMRGEKKREDKRLKIEMNKTREIEKLLMLKWRDNVILLWTIKDIWKEITIEHQYLTNIFFHEQL